MSYIIGVDGGGTKTEAVAYNLKGEELVKTVCGFGNLVIDKEEAVRNIILSIEECINKLKNKELKAIYIGLAGVESGNNKDIVSEAIKDRFSVEPVIINDGELALKAVLEGNDGILTIAGTGSIAIGINGDKRARSGGWGHILGDEGSGYKIALEAFKRIAYENDCGIENSNLTNEILKELNMKDNQEIIGFIYSSKKDEIARFSCLVEKLGESKDRNAISILEKEGIELAKTTERVCKKLGFNDGVTIGIKGSVIEKALIVREAFNKYIIENIKNVKIINKQVSSTKGAYYMYLKEMKK